MKDDEAPPQAATAAINLTGLTQDCNGGDWCDVAGEKTGVESQLWGMRPFMSYRAEVRKHAYLRRCFLVFWWTDADGASDGDDASCFKTA